MGHLMRALRLGAALDISFIIFTSRRFGESLVRRPACSSAL